MELPRRRLVPALTAVAVAAVGLVALLVPPRPAPAGRPSVPVPSPQHRIVVEVLNGTARPGLARVATRALRRQGLDVVFFGNTDDRAPATRVVVRRGNPAAGERVARALGAGTVVVQTDTLRRVDVSVILGDDYRPPAEVRP